MRFIYFILLGFLIITNNCISWENVYYITFDKPVKLSGWTTDQTKTRWQNPTNIDSQLGSNDYAIDSFLKDDSYTFQEMLMFRPFGINVGISTFSAQKDKFREEFSLSSPGILFDFSLNYRFARSFSSQLMFTYIPTVNNDDDRVKIEIPELVLAVNTEQKLFGRLFLSEGIGAGFYAALSSAELATVNFDKITVGKQSIRKIKYGYGFLGKLSLIFYFNESSSLSTGLKYNYTIIGKPGGDGFGNLGGLRLNLGYFYYF